MNNEIYHLNIWNFDKQIPKNYDNLIIPEIEKITKGIMGDIIKYTIYNQVVYYYNKGIKNGTLEQINIYSKGKTKKIKFDINKNHIKLKLISE